MNMSHDIQINMSEIREEEHDQKQEDQVENVDQNQEEDGLPRMVKGVSGLNVSGSAVNGDSEEEPEEKQEENSRYAVAKPRMQDEELIELPDEDSDESGDESANDKENRRAAVAVSKIRMEDSDEDVDMDETTSAKKKKKKDSPRGGKWKKRKRNK